MYLFFTIYIYLLIKRINNHDYDEIQYFIHDIDFLETGEINLSMDRDDIGIYTGLTKNFNKEFSYDDNVKKHITINYV